MHIIVGIVLIGIALAFAWDYIFYIIGGISALATIFFGWLGFGVFPKFMKYRKEANDSENLTATDSTNRDTQNNESNLGVSILFIVITLIFAGISYKAFDYQSTWAANLETERAESEQRRIAKEAQEVAEKQAKEEAEKQKAEQERIAAEQKAQEDKLLAEQRAAEEKVRKEKIANDRKDLKRYILTTRPILEEAEKRLTAIYPNMNLVASASKQKQALDVFDDIEQKLDNVEIPEVAIHLAETRKKWLVTQKKMIGNPILSGTTLSSKDMDIAKQENEKLIAEFQALSKEIARIIDSVKDVEP